MKAQQEVIQETLEEVQQKLQELLEWSASHPGLSLRELEERVQRTERQMRERVMEKVVELQGAGKLEEERCSCGGKLVFQGYRERG